MEKSPHPPGFRLVFLEKNITPEFVMNAGSGHRYRLIMLLPAIINFRFWISIHHRLDYDSWHLVFF